MHTYYSDLVGKEKSETERVMRAARTIEAKEIAARRRTFKMARNHRRLMKEHLMLQLHVPGIGSGHVPESTAHHEDEHSRKRKRPCLTLETLAKLDADAMGEREESRSSCMCAGEGEDGMRDRPTKRFRLNRRLRVD